MSATDEDIFRRLKAGGRHLVSDFQGFTEAQRLAIPDILARKAVLIVARTASGKTEAVLAPLLTLLHHERWTGCPSILYVAPTRALVNDIHGRLVGRLSGFVEVGRRTGEYREPDSRLLVTTPESLDSMLARGRTADGHVLRQVRAVVLDELHLLAESARGTQLQVLLARLDQMVTTPVQRVALSATVPAPEHLAKRFLGANAAICIGGGSRSIEVDGCQGNGIPPRGDGIDPLSLRFLRAGDINNLYVDLAERLVALRKELGGLKALVFTPTRARCDQLTATLSHFLKGRVPIEVHAHHGSLDKEFREQTETALARSEEAVAVATSTLEVGIDVGDVGVVVLDGPPPSVGSLLQRIGRGSRRSEKTFVVAVVRNDVEAVMQASMLRAAIEGDLDPSPDTAHYSVAIQQVASILRQVRGRPSATRLAGTLAAAFGGRGAWLIEHLVSDGWLEVVGGGGLRPSETLADLMDQPMRLHANIGGGRMIPLVEAVTGEALAWVPAGTNAKKIVLAGSSYVPIDRGDVIELSNPVRGGTGKPMRYANRAAPLGRNALRHLARGLGLSDRVLIMHQAECIHFGGELFARILTCGGIKSGPLRANEDPRKMTGADVAKIAARDWERLERLCCFGPFQHDLPRAVRKEAVVETVLAHGFAEWLESLEPVATLSAEQAAVLDQA